MLPSRMLCWSKTTHKLQAQLSTACKQVQSKEVEPERLACMCQPTGDCFRLFHTVNRVNGGRADRGYILVYIWCPGYDATSYGIWKHAYATYWCPLRLRIHKQRERVAFHQNLRCYLVRPRRTPTPSAGARYIYTYIYSLYVQHSIKLCAQTARVLPGNLLPCSCTSFRRTCPSYSECQMLRLLVSQCRGGRREAYQYAYHTIICALKI